jgi:hypothetical protein
MHHIPLNKGMDALRVYFATALGLRTRSVRSSAPILAATMKSFSVSPPAAGTTENCQSNYSGL